MPRWRWGWATTDLPTSKATPYSSSPRAGPAGVVVEIAHEKPPKRKLSFSQKLYNQLVSPLRVVIEHARSGIKCLRMVKGSVRIRNEWFRDTAMVVACGLHNLRVLNPHRAYLAYQRANLAN